MEEVLDKLRVDITASSTQYQAEMKKVEEVTKAAQKIVEAAKDKINQALNQITPSIVAPVEEAKSKVEEAVQAVSAAKAASAPSTAGTPSAPQTVEAVSTSAVSAVSAVKEQLDTIKPELEAVNRQVSETKENMEQISVPESVVPQINKVTEAVADAKKQVEDTVNEANKVKTVAIPEQSDQSISEASGAMKELVSEIEAAKNKIQELGAAASSTGSDINKIVPAAGQAERSIVRMTISPQKNNLNGHLKGIKNSLNQLSSVSNSILKRTTTGMNKLEHTTKMLKNRLMNLVLSVFIFEMIRKSAVALKDYLMGAVKTNDEYANSINRIKTNMQVAFAPIYSVALPALNQLMERLNTASYYIASFINQLFGGTYASGLKAAKGIKAATDATKGYGAASNKLAPASFHELTNLTSASSGGGSDSPVAELVPTEGDESAVTKFIDKVKEKLKPVTEALDRLKEGGLKLVGIFGNQAFQDFYNDFLKPLGDWALGEGLPALIDAINDMLTKIDWESLNAALDDFWIAIEPYAEAVGKGIVDFVTNITTAIGSDGGKTVTDFLNKLTNELNEGDPDQVQKYTTKILGFAVAVIALNAAIKAITGTLTALSSVITLVKSVGAGLGTVFQTLSAIVAFNPATLVMGFAVLEQKFPKLAGNIKYYSSPSNWPDLGGPLGGIVKLIQEISKWNDFVIDAFGKSFLNQLKQSFSWTTQLFEEAGKFFEEGGAENIVKGLATGIAGAVTFLFEPISRIFIAITDAFLEIFGIHSPAKKMEPFGKNIVLGMVNGFSTSIEDFVKKIPEKMDKVKLKVKTAVMGIANTVISIIESMSNGVIKGINKVVQLLNAFSFKIPSWVPEFGGKEFGLSLNEVATISIPRIKLASGGIVTKATNALIGEAGREAVLPLDSNTGWMSSFATVIASVMYEAVYTAFVRALAEASGTEGDITVNIDGERLFTIIRNKNRVYKNSTGHGAFE